MIHSDPVCPTSHRPASDTAPGSQRTHALRILHGRHFSPFKLYLRRDLKLAVMLNPKVGSTTFRRVLVEGLQEAGIAPTLSRLWPIRLSRRYLTAPPTDFLDVLLRPQQYTFHCFVRNPYARLLSAWKDKFSMDKAGKPLARSMKREMGVVRQFAHRQGLPGAACGSPMPLATFVAYVASQREGRRNQHWDTQYVVLACDAIKYNHIYHMETDFVTGMTRILTQVGLDQAWVEQRLSKPRNASRRLDAPVYTAELAEQVFEIYRKDFEAFRYPCDGWQGL